MENRKNFVINVRINGAKVNAVLDSGAGVSIIDRTSLEALNICLDLKPSHKQLFDASGNTMDVDGVVFLNVEIPVSKETYRQIFYVIGNRNASKLLLGRDFMERFGVISFDFTQNIVKLGKYCVHGAVLSKAKDVRLHSKSLVPRRSESILTVKCHPNLAFIPVDFEPRKVPDINGLYISNARILPNVSGELMVSVLNVTELDVELHPRTRIGKIITPRETLNDNRSKAHNVLFPSEEVSIEESLEVEEKTEVQRLLREYEDVFAINPKKNKKDYRIRTPYRYRIGTPCFSKAQENSKRVEKRSRRSL